jgi:hypothetical protein
MGDYIEKVDVVHKSFFFFAINMFMSFHAVPLTLDSPCTLLKCMELMHSEGWFMTLCFDNESFVF